MRQNAFSAGRDSALDPIGGAYSTLPLGRDPPHFHSISFDAFGVSKRVAPSARRAHGPKGIQTALRVPQNASHLPRLPLLVLFFTAISGGKCVKKSSYSTSRSRYLTSLLVQLCLYIGSTGKIFPATATFVTVYKYQKVGLYRKPEFYHSTSYYVTVCIGILMQIVISQ